MRSSRSRIWSQSVWHIVNVEGVVNCNVKHFGRYTKKGQALFDNYNDGKERLSVILYVQIFYQSLNHLYSNLPFSPLVASFFVLFCCSLPSFHMLLPRGQTRRKTSPTRNLRTWFNDSISGSVDWWHCRTRGRGHVKPSTPRPWAIALAFWLPSQIYLHSRWSWCWFGWDVWLAEQWQEYLLSHLRPAW